MNRTKFPSGPAAEDALRSICLVRLSALGDVVLSVPLVRWLQRRLPETRLTWIVSRSFYPVIAGLAADGIDLVPIDKPKGVLDYWRFRRRMAGRQFDALLCLQASWRANFLYPSLRARRRIGYGRDRAKDGHRWFVRETLPPAAPHLVDGFLQFSEALGLARPNPNGVEWHLPIDTEAVRWADEVLPWPRFVAVSACASKPERDWDVQRLASVLKAIHEKKALPIVLLGGPAPRETHMAQRLLAISGIPALNLVGRTDLPRLVATLSRTSLLIAPDTGAVHIARAFQRPVLGLYAVAPASRTGPYGCAATCVDVFEEAVRTLQSKDPATLSWAHRVHDPRAMELISVAAVLSKADSILKNTSETIP